MCGVLGWIDPSLNDGAAAMRMVEPALATLAERGPDDARLEWGPGWILGHTRLAIIDLSRRSGQPMTDGRGLWLVYNGEIYNFRELRSELEGLGCRFHSSGDAEVLLQSLRQWGLECLPRLRGMFAFALLDTTRRELVMARDRFGVKPLAYDVHGQGIRFASDLRALRSLPDGRRDIDAESAYLYMALGYIPAPHTISRGVRKVKPGHYVRVRWSNSGVEDVREVRYWSINSVQADGDAAHMSADAEHEFEARAFEAVRYRLISDVPLGTFLSGGIDSTLVTACSRELEPDAELATFTMGFDDPAHDESPFARAIARELKTSHHEFRLSTQDIQEGWSRLWHAYDEPFADSSALPTLMLSRFAASSVKVALTGDGGDETGCGYDWHQALDRFETALKGTGPNAVDRIAGFRLRHHIPSGRPLDRVHLWSILRTGLSDERLGLLPLADPLNQQPLSEYFREWSRELDPAVDCFTWAGQLDLLTYVPDDLMVKSDRASMSVGLELREPLLDHDLTKWFLRAPVSARIDRESGRTKLPSRRFLARRIPTSLFEELPKHGFTAPLPAWLSGPLAEPLSEALERLGSGRLDPVVLPSGCTSWRDTDPILNDEGKTFLWRVMCFSEWLRNNSSPMDDGPRSR